MAFSRGWGGLDYVSLVGGVHRCLWKSIGFDFKEAMRRSRTTRHGTEGDIATFIFSPGIPDEFTCEQPFRDNVGIRSGL